MEWNSKVSLPSLLLPRFNPVLHVTSELSNQEIDSIEPQLVIDATHRGDQYAINILPETGINLGKGICIQVQMFHPELIIRGG